ncbi:hypothetical protein N658DRAFT_516491 [Parathielavia hyrcaniae]|uniref:Acyltransferase 3 domain-containing protein n=1 Tax=Parathielavia hyrcaniae TaxID=113614 RepID=A0AAN6T0K3_9PEZI|nr:hypothetical protein N658DRAFT_516491 [Parathielavia hyrcaniae]
MRSSDYRRGAASTSSIQSFLSPRRPWVRFLRPILPSFVADALFPEHRPTWRLHPTSYLDGLRGIAAMIVFVCHYTENNFHALVRSYGLGDPETAPSSWIQLPFLRVVFSGRPMVHIFFVISGFALSYKPVLALHARDLDRFYAALASSTFRRAFRLFGPCVVSTFMIMCLRQMGYLAPAEPTLYAELSKWKDAVFHSITWPWAWDFDLRPKFDVHLWTIPIEFAHSMLLFMVLLMLSRVRMWIRMASVFGLMIYCLTCGKWAGFEFLAGMFLAEIHVLRAGAKSKEGEVDDEETDWPLKTFQVCLILIGLFLAGWPNKGAEFTPGIRYFLSQTPFPFATMDPLAPQKYWFALSAVAAVWAIGDLAFLRGLFESPLAQYFGRISYAVYICHGPVEQLFRGRLLGHPFIPSRGEPGAPDYVPALPATGVKGFIGVETIGQTTVGWFIGLWLLGPLVVWAADLFWRAVDSRIVNLARRLETVCLDDTEPRPRGHGYSAAA